MNFSETPNPPDRVICYVDGFNLYFGLRDSGLRRYYWLNVHSLAECILHPRQELLITKYFTARISGPSPSDSPKWAQQQEEKRKRQSDFLEALETIERLTIYEGHFLAKPVCCNNCGACWKTHEEKMTDVNIATELLMDAFRDNFDTAIIISADSDLVPPIRAVLQYFPAKRVVVAFPIGRHSARLGQVASASFRIGKKKYRDSQFPKCVCKPDGHVLQRPDSWN